MAENIIEDPNDYCCPITNALFEDPVVAEDGQSYERSAITDWFQRNRTSPFTNEPLKSVVLYDNHRLKAIIDHYRGNGPEINEAQRIIQNLQETINVREAAFNDQLRQEKEKSLEVLQNYNIEIEKNAAIENELAGLRRDKLLLQKKLAEVNKDSKAKDEEIKASRLLQERLMQANATIKNKEEEIKFSNWKLMEANATIKAKDEEIKASMHLQRKLMEANNTIKVREEESLASATLIKNKDTEIRFSQGQLVEKNTAIRAKDEEIKKLKEELAQLASQDFRPLFPPHENATTWVCEKCTLENQNCWNLCQKCENLKPGISGWVCKKCKLINNQNTRVCDRCRHKRKMKRPIVASRETERNTVLNYEKDGYGDAFYAISPDWITNWFNFTKGEDQRPGKIITSLFIDSKGSLKQDLKESRDYQMINKRQWEYLHQIYGGDAPLICSSRNIYNLKDPNLLFERPISSRISGNGVNSYNSMQNPFNAKK